MTTAIVKRENLGLDPHVEARFWTWLESLDHSLAAEREALEGGLATIRDRIHVVDVDTMSQAADIATCARTRLRELEDERKTYSGPLHRAKALVDQVYKASTNPLANSIDTLKDKIAAWTAKREAERRATMVQSAAVYAAGGTPTDPIPEPPRAPGVSVRRVWVARVVDAEQVPRNLCSPDPTKIADAIAYADTETPPRPIPGLEFHQEERVAIRG